MFERNTILLLRIPFSFFLMPVYFFALSACEEVNLLHAVLVFFVLHLFIYPASNGYNSYMDKDEGSIGGLRNPPKVTKQLFHISVLFDFIGLAISFIIGSQFFICVLLYVIASRAYSFKGIRIKKYPLLSYFTVMVFQGWLTFFMCYNAMSVSPDPDTWITPAPMAAFFLIGGVYPLTQIYQHEEDRKNGDKTISILVGYHGTFILTAVMFTISTLCLYLVYNQSGKLLHFLVLQAFLAPVIIYFLYWWRKVSKQRSYADFDHTMRMNLLASICMNLCFIFLIVLNHIA